MLQVSRSNERQLILNEDIFGPLKNESIVIVIQVGSKLQSSKVHYQLLLILFPSGTQTIDQLATFNK